MPRKYFWKSAKRLEEIVLTAEDELGFWERNGYNNGAELAGGALLVNPERSNVRSSAGVRLELSNGTAAAPQITALR